MQLRTVSLAQWFSTCRAFLVVHRELYIYLVLLLRLRLNMPLNSLTYTCNTVSTSFSWGASIAKCSIWYCFWKDGPWAKRRLRTTGLEWHFCLRQLDSCPAYVWGLLNITVLRNKLVMVWREVQDFWKAHRLSDEKNVLQFFQASMQQRICFVDCVRLKIKIIESWRSFSKKLQWSICPTKWTYISQNFFNWSWVDRYKSRKLLLLRNSINASLSPRENTTSSPYTLRQ